MAGVFNASVAIMINWFPGHMHKAQKELRKALKFIDVVVEVADSRAPEASRNPLLHEICDEKPIVTLFNKTDLTDLDKLKDYIKEAKVERTLLGTANTRGIIEPLLVACKKAAPHRDSPVKPLRIAIVGTPNVGKSTLINTLAEKKIAKVGNVPAVTRHMQKISIRDDVQLIDSPGIMMPRSDVKENMLFLAAFGSIGAKALDEVEIVLDMLDVLRNAYPEALINRYGLKELDSDSQVLMEAIAGKIGAVKGTSVYWEKAAARILADLRSGELGKVCLVADVESDLL